MGILEKTSQLKEIAQKHGNYREVSKESGVNFHWLQKFAAGHIDNPQIKNVAKIEAYFDKPTEPA